MCKCTCSTVYAQVSVNSTSSTLCVTWASSLMEVKWNECYLRPESCQWLVIIFPKKIEQITFLQCTPIKERPLKVSNKFHFLGKTFSFFLIFRKKKLSRHFDMKYSPLYGNSMECDRACHFMGKNLFQFFEMQLWCSLCREKRESWKQYSIYIFIESFAV